MAIVFILISRRHQKRSTGLTTNLAYKEWDDVSWAASVEAMLDRFAQHCYTMDIEGASWRSHERVLRESKQKKFTSR